MECRERLARLRNGSLMLEVLEGRVADQAVGLRLSPLDLLLGCESIGATSLSQKEIFGLHKIFCAFLSHAWKERASWSGGSPVLGQNGRIEISSGVWPWPFE